MNFIMSLKAKISTLFENRRKKDLRTEIAILIGKHKNIIDDIKNFYGIFGYYKGFSYHSKDLRGIEKEMSVILNDSKYFKVEKIKKEGMPVLEEKMSEENKELRRLCDYAITFTLIFED